MYYFIGDMHLCNKNQTIITYMQRVSPCEYGQVPPMDIRGNYTVKGERGGRISAKEEALRDFQSIGFLRDLDIVSGESVSFRFRDINTRAWIRVSLTTLSVVPLFVGMKFLAMPV